MTMYIHRNVHLRFYAAKIYSKLCLAGPPPLPDVIRYIHTLLTSTEHESKGHATLLL